MLQHDVSTQADMLQAYSSPKEPYTPVLEDNSAVSFTDDMYVNIILLLLWLHLVMCDTADTLYLYLNAV